MSPVALATAGELDVAFGGDGRVDVVRPVAVAVGPDGMVVVLDGSWIPNVHRFDGHGAPDPTFSKDGVAAIEVPYWAKTWDAMLLAVAADGSVIVAGEVSYPALGYFIVRVGPTGAQDFSFGHGGAVTDVSLGEGPVDLDIQPDGDVLVSTATKVLRYSPAGDLVQTVEGGGPLGVDASGRTYLVDLTTGGAGTLRRLTESLATDPSYAAGGSVELATLTTADSGEYWSPRIDVASDGSVVVAFMTRRLNDPLVVLARLTEQGSLAGPSAVTEVVASSYVSLPERLLAVEHTADDGVAVFGIKRRSYSYGATMWMVGADGTVQRTKVVDTTQNVTVAVDAAMRRAYVTTASSLDAYALMPVAPTRAPILAPITIDVRGSGQVSWTAVPELPAEHVDGYRVILRDVETSHPVITVDVPASATSTLLYLGSRGRRLVVSVAAMNAAGVGPASISPVVLPPFATVPAFVDRQFVDFLGRAPTAAERASLADRVEAGTTAPGAAVAEVAGMAPWPLLDGVTRLYYAYFGRIPDGAGLRYWHGQRVGGTSLYQISKAFAASWEFRSRYGALSNQGFVELVYQNVLGRAGDPGGIAYWVGELDSGRRTRGGVMVGFSESAEHEARRRGEVVVTSTYLGMLERVPVGWEVDVWGDAVVADGRAALAAHLLASDEYANRILSLPSGGAAG